MSDPQPNPETVPVPDPELVTLQGTYRIGVSPPVAGSLAPGELYIQIPADGAAPVMFVGGLEATVVSMVTGPPPAGTTTASRASAPASTTHTATHTPPKEDPKEKK